MWGVCNDRRERISIKVENDGLIRIWAESWRVGNFRRKGVSGKNVGRKRRIWKA